MGLEPKRRGERDLNPNTPPARREERRRDGRREGRRSGLHLNALCHINGQRARFEVEEGTEVRLPGGEEKRRRRERLGGGRPQHGTLSVCDLVSQKFGVDEPRSGSSGFPGPEERSVVPRLIAVILAGSPDPRSVRDSSPPGITPLVSSRFTFAVAARRMFAESSDHAKPFSPTRIPGRISPRNRPFHPAKDTGPNVMPAAREFRARKREGLTENWIELRSWRCLVQSSEQIP
jgi:hypothetical protein